jgi:LCP family protein required for cell wall assembly
LSTSKHLVRDDIGHSKHLVKSTNKYKNARRVRAVLITLFLILVAFGGMSYAYAKMIEYRLHGGFGEVVDDPLAAPCDPGYRKYVAAKENEPVTILLLGSDTREVGVRGNSDSMMLLRMNPDKKIAYLISIPRDSWVDIPDHRKNKINAAYSYGGPDLAAETVEKLTGLTINHYVNIDFQGFKDIINALGGIDIDVEKKIRDHFSGRYIKFDPGMQHLDGDEALDYVRVRHVDNDFQRAGRQQQFLSAIMEKVSSFSGAIKLPWLIEIASQKVRTDRGLSLPQMLSYAQMARSIDRNNFNMTTLEGAEGHAGKLSIVELDRQKLTWLVNRIKNNMPLTLTAKEKQNEKIKVTVQNGSGKSKVAKEMADKLINLNYKVGEVGNAKEFGHETTHIITTGGKLKMAESIRDKIGFGQIIDDETVTADEDVLIIVGNDFARTVKTTSTDLSDSNQ